MTSVLVGGGGFLLRWNPTMLLFPTPSENLLFLSEVGVEQYAHCGKYYSTSGKDGEDYSNGDMDSHHALSRHSVIRYTIYRNSITSL